MSLKINKNGKEYDLGFIPKHYPADRVYLDGDTSKTVQDAVDAINITPSETFVSYGTTSPVTIPNIKKYRYITVGYCISSQTRFFSLSTLPTASFRTNIGINIIYDGNESEVTYNNDTSVNIRFNSTLQWPIKIILS